MKGYLKQKGIPTPDKPVPIETQVIGESLFKTYEVNGRQYTDNLPQNALISIPKKQYIEYEQQKEEIERLNKCYCERTDCSGRIKNSAKFESLQVENERLNNIINNFEKWLEEQENNSTYPSMIFIGSARYKLHKLKGDSSNDKSNN